MVYFSNTTTLHAFRTRLARLLGMVGSDHDGEALNAARLADRMVRESGITWQDVLISPPVASAQPQASSTNDPLRQFETVFDAVNFALMLAPMLTAWEMNFLRSLPSFRRVSEKQLAVLRRLIARAIAAGARP
jgi:hypothetical protein